MVQRILATLLLAVGSMTLLAVSVAPTANAACPSGKILTIKPWYDGLLDEANGCAVKSPGDNEKDQRAFISRVVLNVIDGLLQVVAFVTIGFIIFGGFKFLTSAGSPEQAAKARKTIINSVIGMVIAIGAVGLVNLVGAALGI